MKPKSIRECLDIIFKNFKSRDEFDGLQMLEKVSALNEKYSFKYIDTIMRCCRKYYRNRYICISHAKSRYQVI